MKSQSKSRFKGNPLATFIPGDQIAYIPHHADGDIRHKDVQFGFVRSEASPSMNGGGLVIERNYFCRYFHGMHDDDLRTMANSERTGASMLIHFKSRPTSVINSRIGWIDEQEARDGQSK